MATTPGVLYRHSRACKGETCANNCNSDSDAPWQAWVFDAKYVDAVTGKKGKKIVRRFPDFAAAKGWRADASGEVRRQKLRATDRATAQRTLADEVKDWLEGAKAGAIQTKRETAYKPAVIRNYELSLRLRVLPTLGDRRFTEIRLGDLLALKEQLVGAGCSGSTVRNSFVPLQAIYRRARLQQRIEVDPTADLPLPTAGSRERAATPEQGVELLGAIDGREAAVWATAFYAGLRRGELRALRVGAVDLEALTIAVEHGWDDVEGEIAPKSRAGRRTVFVLEVLKPHLEPLVEGRAADEFVFGSGTGPFDPRAIMRKAERAWNAVDQAAKASAEEAEEDPPAPLVRFTLHEARHSFSTWMDHAGISGDRADRYMGHSDGSVSGRYRHLLPKQIFEDRAELDRWLAGDPAEVVPIASVASPAAPAAASPAVGAISSGVG